MKDYISEPARPVFESGVPTKPTIAADHPDRQAMLDDADYHWHWLPSTWAERDRAARERATKADILDLFDEIGELRQRLAEVSRRPVSASREVSPTAGRSL